jgi:hypothetical protein
VTNQARLFDESVPDVRATKTYELGGAPSVPTHTSRAAATRIEGATHNLRGEVFAAIEEAGATGLTDEEGMDVTSIAPNTYRPRRRELEQARVIRPRAETRPTRSGRQAQVWVIRG